MDMAKSPACRWQVAGAVCCQKIRMNRRRLQLFYSGRVQGVGFRYQVRRLAAAFEVVGFVRNLADGRVELVAEGSVTELKDFQQAVRDSGLGPLIRDETEIWSEPGGEFRGFEITR